MAGTRKSIESGCCGRKVAEADACGRTDLSMLKKFSYYGAEV
jgi:hypothetical protein